MTRLKLLTALLCIFTTNFVSANEPYIISKIVISGLERTKESTVLKIIKFKSGDLISSDDIPDIEQKLLKEEIFVNNIEIKLKETSLSNADLIIRLEDKWTIVPIPVVVVSSSSFLLGGVFIESNLLGLNHSLVTGHFYNGKKVNGFASWEIPENKIGTLSLSLNYTFGETSYYDFDENEVEIDKSSDRVGIKVRFKRDITNSLYFNVGIKEELYDKDFYTYLDTGITYDNVIIKPFFQEGIQGSIENSIRNKFATSSFENIIKASIDHSKVIGNHLLNSTISCGKSFNPEDNSILFGGEKGARVIKSKSVKVENYLMTQTKIELKIADLNWGYITIPIYYEGGVVEASFASKYYYHGPGAGASLYLKKVAFPAFGFNYTYDVHQNNYNFSVALGYGI